MKFVTIVKSYTTKEGNRSFIKATIKGSYLPAELGADANTYYQVKVVKNNAKQLPVQVGCYWVETTNAWLDKRPDTKFPTIWIKDNEVKFDFYKNI